MFKRKDKNNSLETKIIGIAGAGEKSGCTHACIILANRIRAAGCSVAILEENKSSCFRKIAEEFECEVDNEGKFVHCSIDYFTYRKPRLLPIILKQGYDFLIIDHGNFGDCDKDFYLTNHMHIIVCGSRPWEMDAVQEIFETVQTEEMLEAFHYCFNFAHDNLHLQRNIRKAMGTLSNVCFPPYSEDVFHNSDFGDLDDAIGISVADNVPKTEGIRMLGMFSKKKEEKKPESVATVGMIEEKKPEKKEKISYPEENIPEANYSEVSQTKEEPVMEDPEPLTEKVCVMETPVTEIITEETSAIEIPVTKTPLPPVINSVTKMSVKETIKKEEPKVTKENPITEEYVEKQNVTEIPIPITEVPVVEENNVAVMNDIAEEDKVIVRNNIITEHNAAEENSITENTSIPEQNDNIKIKDEQESFDSINVCFESDEQAMKLFNEIKEIRKFACYKLKNQNAKTIETIMNKCLRIAYVSLLRSGVPHTREAGNDASPVISIKNETVNYEMRESILREMLGKEDYLIDPYEDNFVDF